jgi:hypothetical protein
MSRHNKYRGGGLTQSTESPVVSPPSVLFITTHGAYTGLETTFKSPMNVKKINSTILGVCNMLLPESAGIMAQHIKDAINHGFVANMDQGSKLIRDIVIANDKELPRGKNRTQGSTSKEEKGGKDYMIAANRSYQINYFNEDQDVIDKTFIVITQDKSEIYPFFNTATLLTEDSNIDLFAELDIPPFEGDDGLDRQEIMLSDILKHLKKEKKIQNLIIVDLTCNVVVGHSDREIRLLNRTETNYGGYNRKTKINKKKNYKKTKRNYKKTKSNNKKTKRNKKRKNK